jgi:subtilase family serine protease
MAKEPTRDKPSVIQGSNMRIRSLFTGAVLGALVLPAVSSSGAAVATDAASDRGTTTFNVYLPLTHTEALEELLSQQTDQTSPNYHRWLTPAQFKNQFGPSPANFAVAREALESAGFTIVAEHTQNLTAQGPVAAVEKLLSTQLTQVKTQGGKLKWAAANHGRLTLPQTLANLGAVIPEFAPHLAAHVHSRVVQAADTGHLAVGGIGSTLGRLANVDSFFYANDLNEAYQLPSFRAQVTPPLKRNPVQLAGVGSTIGIVISSVIDPADLAASFNSSISAGGISDVQNYSVVANLPVPTVTLHAVNGGAGAFDPNSADGDEASLDTQMSLGTAPGAKEIVYDMPDLTDANIMAAYAQVDEENLVDVVSSSFGECELDFTAAANGGVDFTGILKQFHALFQQGNAQGITFLASSGDNGAAECIPPAFQSNPTTAGTNFVLGVSNPASDPSVTAVGGTNLQSAATPTANDVSYLSENADFDPRLPVQAAFGNVAFTIGNNTWGSGGGFSQIFAKPAYQFLVPTGSLIHRSVPDVSLMMGGCPGDADLNKQDCTQLPRSAAIVWIGGIPFLLIGTSSSSPEMAGVLAIAVEKNGGRLGNVNPLIYSLSALQTLLGGANAPAPFQFFHRNVSGNNNGFTVRPGQAYSEVLGNGTLDVRNFLGLQGVAPAGAPGTASNP